MRKINDQNDFFESLSIEELIELREKEWVTMSQSEKEYRLNDNGELSFLDKIIEYRINKKK